MKTTTDILSCIPVQLIESELNEDSGKIVLLTPKFKSALAEKLIGRYLKKNFMRVNLDDIGSVTWKNIDGKKTVKEIGETLAAEFGPDIEPIYDRLSQFLLQMHQQKFIRLDCPQTNDN